MSHLAFEMLAKSTIILLVAWTVTAVIQRRSSAARRHLVWSAALAGVLALPAAIAGAAAWDLAVRLPVWTSSVSPDPSAVRATESGTDGGTGMASSAVPAGSLVRVIDPESLFTAPSAIARAVRWVDVLLAVWIAGTCFLLARIVGGLAWTVALVRRATPVADVRWLSELRNASDQLRLRRHVPILQSAQVEVPVVCGIVRPRLLVPADSERWDHDRRWVVLLHELAHVTRGDCATQLLAQITFALLWFHPLVLLALANLRTEQECATDDLVLGSGASAPDYARHLCDIAEAARGRRLPIWAALAMAHSSRLGHRVSAILDATTRRAPASRRLSAWVGVVACAGVATIAPLRPGLAAAAAAESRAPTRRMPAPPLLSSPRAAGTLAAQVSAAPRDATESLDGMVKRHCVACHSNTRRAAGVSFETLAAERPIDAPDIWERSIRKLRSGTHPPIRSGGASPSSTAPEPLDKAAADVLVAGLESALDREEPAHWTSTLAAPLNDAAVARRVARFLWSADPDDRLRSAGARLNDPAALASEIRRMIDDPQAAAFAKDFSGQWLYLRNLRQARPDPAVFPTFDDDLREGLQRETELFIRSQIQDDRPVTELLTANYTFLNERLARHYGVASITGPEFRRVTMPDDARSGLLGQGSILTVTSYAHRTSPVLRGKWVLETLLGVSPPPPPPNVPALPEPTATVSGRSRLETSVKAPVCASCHSTIDPIGFALENFDAIGQWRNTDGASAVDASGVLAGASFNGPAELRTVLMVRQDAFVHTLTSRLLAYALGRELKHYDMPAVRTIVRESAPANHRWASLISGIVRSTPFRMERVSP